jgi:hypothetical protein
MDRLAEVPVARLKMDAISIELSSLWTSSFCSLRSPFFPLIAMIGTEVLGSEFSLNAASGAGRGSLMLVLSHKTSRAV